MTLYMHTPYGVVKSVDGYDWDPLVSYWQAIHDLFEEMRNEN